MRKSPKGKAGQACVECGAPMRSCREPHRYTITPAWAITIADAEVLRCPKCGTWEVVIPKPDALQRTIAAEVIHKSSPLAGPEVTFLRRCLGLNGRELARALGIEGETLSRYEHATLRVQPQVDRLLRMMVAAQFLVEGERFGVEALSSIDKDVKEPAPLKLVVTVDPKGTWRRAAA
jgi:putative zinc finger/helix-turn-helix YgiT family protein